MGVVGSYTSVQYPKWFLSAIGLSCVIAGAGLSIGVRYAFGEARLARMERQDSVTSVRVDLLRTDVDGLNINATTTAELIRGLARARCRETPALAADVGLPCATLQGAR